MPHDKCPTCGQTIKKTEPPGDAEGQMFIGERDEIDDVLDECEFDCVGKNGGTYVVPRETYDKWVKLFPTIDVLRNIRNASAWVFANPSRRKTRSGMTAFITGWLTRETNRGGGQRQSFNPAGDTLKDRTPTQREIEISKGLDPDDFTNNRGAEN